jgi:hypothetical protein
MAAAGVMLGFTAATGAALQAHELLSWALWVDADAPPVALQPGAGCACALLEPRVGSADAACCDAMRRATALAGLEARWVRALRSLCVRAACQVRACVAR